MVSVRTIFGGAGDLNIHPGALQVLSNHSSIWYLAHCAPDPTAEVQRRAGPPKKASVASLLIAMFVYRCMCLAVAPATIIAYPIGTLPVDNFLQQKDQKHPF